MPRTAVEIYRKLGHYSHLKKFGSVFFATAIRQAPHERTRTKKVAERKFTVARTFELALLALDSKAFFLFLFSLVTKHNQTGDPKKTKTRKSRRHQTAKEKVAYE